MSGRFSALAFLGVHCAGLTMAVPSNGEEAWTLESPSSRLKVEVRRGEELTYAVSLRGEPVVLPSAIDLKIEGAGWMAGDGGPCKATTRSAKETIEFPVPRKYRRLDVKYNELRLALGNGDALVFRAYDEGVAYRWHAAREGEIVVAEERAQFTFPDKTKAWFPEEESIFSHQERQYKHLELADVGEDRFGSTGVLVDLPGGRKLYLSESDLASYPGMFLRGMGAGKPGLVGKFAPYALETEAKNDRDVPVTKAAPYLARTAGPRSFPWRVMIVTEDDAELLTSELVYALAPPSEIGDASWIKPGKVAWEWWNAIDVYGVDFKAGVNTETYKYFVDFAADHGVAYLLLDEGWCADSSDVLSVREGLDLEELVRYGQERGVGVILWVLWNALDVKLEPALEKYEQLGVAGIKVDFMQRDDQWMVEYYHRIARQAAKHRLMVDFHGAYKPTGLRRQFPNVMTSEGVTGLEQYKWTDQMTNPEQELVLPFVRMVAGPMDFTPGAMSNASRGDWKAIGNHPMSFGTRCHQLAMFVVYESPLQMLADSPTHYLEEPECLEFLAAVPTVWDELHVLEAKAADYVALARKSGDQWFVGAMTDWTRRTLQLKLDFLPEGEYELHAWSDGVNAERNGRDFRRSVQQVKRGAVVQAELAPGGGWAGWIKPVRRPAR